MKSLTRKTLGDEAAQIIAEAIRSGELTGTLPGYRTLIQKLGISRAAFEPAIHKLVEEGWLVSLGPRRRFLINTVEKSETTPRARQRKLWILEPMAHKEPSTFATQISRPLNTKLSKLGWEANWDIVTIDQTRRHHAKWNQLLKAQQPDAILLIAPHRTTAEWAVKCGLPVCALGGDTKNLALTTTGIESSYMVECSLEKMLAVGHRDICLLLTVRTPDFVSRIYKTMKETLANHGIEFVPAWHAPLAQTTTPEGLYELMERRFTLSQPTAMMAFGKNGLNTMMGYLLQRGIAVPRDISLVMLGDTRFADWIRPSIASFEMPWDRVISFLTRWLSTAGHLQDQHHHNSFHPRWIDGESLSTPAQKSQKR